MKTKFKLLNLRNAAVMALAVAGVAVVMNACQEPSVKSSMPSNQVSARPVKDLSVATTECDVTNITANRTLDRDTIYILKGDVRVNNGATLTIEAGTIIKGDKASRGTLTIERGAKIMAVGSSSQPIVFTSAEAPNFRNTRDWGGVNIFGNAPANLNTVTGALSRTAEGYPACVPQLTYGDGTNAADNSGMFRYVRIEYGGIPNSAAPNSEKNGLTLYSVGSGTTIDHVQVSFGDDDGFEWFGGTVNAKYLVSYKNRDDDFDTDHGYSGFVQYGIIVRDPAIADISASNGFESDNNNDLNPGGTTATPLTSAVFSNFTIIGPYDPECLRTVINVSGGQRFQHGLQFRRNTGIDVYNAIVTGWPGRQFSVESNTASITLGSNTAVKPSNVVGAICFFEGVGGTPWTGNVTNVCADATVCDTRDEETQLIAFNANGMVAQSGLSELAWVATPDLAPVAGAAVLTNGQNANSINAFFVSNSTTPGAATFFRGAFRAFGDDNGWDLAGGWLEFNPQIVPYH
jgi:hypothetical protein